MTGGFSGLPGTTTSGTYTQTVYAPNGTPIGTVKNGSLVSSAIPLPGGGDAVYNAAGFSYFRHKDWLGSSRLATTWTHAVYSKTAYAPFGEAYNQTGNTDIDFTGQTQDSASSLLNFMYRKYDSTAGRWTAPDPAGWSVVDFTNPQTFNRYAYVLNKPLIFIDSLGLDPCDDMQDFDDYDECEAQMAEAAQAQEDADEAEAALNGTFFLEVDVNLNSSNNMTVTVTDDTRYLTSSDYNFIYESATMGPQQSFNSSYTPPQGGPGASSTSGFNGCKAWATAKGVFHVGLDIAGTIPFFGSGVSALNALTTETAATWELVASLATNDYNNKTGTGLTYAGAFVGIASKNTGALTIFAAKSAEASGKLAEAVPFLGIAVGAVATAYDLHSAYKEYNECP